MTRKKPKVTPAFTRAATRESYLSALIDSVYDGTITEEQAEKIMERAEGKDYMKQVRKSEAMFEKAAARLQKMIEKDNDRREREARRKHPKNN